MRWVTALLLASMMAASLSAEAEQAPPATPLDAACGAPCGYIIPIIDLDFPDKLLCGGGRLIYAEEPPTDCFPLMAPGESWSIDGTFRMYWDAQEEPTYPMMPDDPIEVEFSGTQNNPSWLDIQIDPPTMTITVEDIYDPDNYDVDLERTPIMYFEYKRPITVTATRIGDPSSADLKKMDDRQGVLAVFIKARSDESGAYYKEAFGVEEFRFQACMEPDIARQICDAILPRPGSGDEAIPVQGEEVESPGLAPLVVLAALAAVALARRRY